MSLRDTCGIVEIGVSNIDLVAPVYDITNIEDKSQLICPICREEYDEDTDKDKIYRKTICKHTDNIFCDDCLGQWLKTNRSCPICDNNLEDVYNDTQSDVNIDDLTD